MPLKDPKGELVNVHADQLEVSPDGKWFRYQPCSGRFSHVETKYLDEPSLSDADLASHVGCGPRGVDQPAEPDATSIIRQYKSEAALAFGYIMLRDVVLIGVCLAHARTLQAYSRHDSGIVV